MQGPDYVMAQACQHGLRVVLTPAVMQGLDYVMAQACQHGLRVVLTLTNYLTAYGGMQTWVQWFGGKSVQEFYTNPTIV